MFQFKSKPIRRWRGREGIGGAVREEWVVLVSRAVKTTGGNEARNGGTRERGGAASPKAGWQGWRHWTGVAVVSKLGREVEMAALVGDGFYDKCRP